ncbi:PAS domain-containing protein [Spirulina subsalsa FACHB-351]|uniref:histidine kinase n=1 Tax=Spirulina subsalsa FACHB-351 TaxID=234711 RepID=A0ABT3L4W3_9CYAN|nr:PAS domain-containing protein [Spirulina subsalsa]MCW6036539.1 PAS domain-containing protein [Spirulina subsalsa FACHB-351]
MPEALHLLLIEDSDDDAELLLRVLRRDGFDLIWERVQTAQALREALPHQPWDVIVSDYNLPGFDAPTALEILKESQQDIPFLVVSGTIGEKLAVEMMKTGASDYIMKGNLARLPETVRREMREAQTRRERRQAEQALRESERRNHAVLMAIPDLMFRVGADGVYRGFVTSSRCGDVIPAQIDPTGKSITAMLPPELAERQLHYIRQALETGELQVYEQTLWVNNRRQDEEVRVVKSGEDEVLFMVRDITQKQAALRQRQQAEEQLHRLNQELETKVAQRTAELQKREAQLQKLSERLSLALKSASMGCWTWQLQDNTLIWDEQMREIYHFPLDAQITYEQWQEYVHPEDLRRLTEDMAKVLKTGREYNTEFRIFLPDGKIRHLKIYGVVVRDEAGHPLTMTGVNVDISEQHAALVQRERAEQDLRASQQFLQTVLDTVPLAVFWKDCALHYQGCNGQFARTLGADSPEQVVGKTDFDLYTEAEALRYRRLDQQVIESGSPLIGIVQQAIFPDGDLHWLDINKLPLRDWRGHIIGVVGTFQDITDRKRAENALQESEEKFRQLVQGIDAVFWIIELERTERVYVSPAYSRIWGRTSDELYISPHAWVEAIHPEDRAGIMAAIPKQIKGEYDEEYRIVRPDGEIRWIRDRAFPIPNAQGQIYRVAGIAEDITDRKIAQAQLQATNEELIRATRLKDEFLANMSHELRTPLNAILGMTEGLQEEIFGPLNDGQLKALQTVERSASHLLELINDILDVAKIESGQVELDCSSTAIAPLCQSSLSFIKQQALKKRIQLSVDLPLNLPDIVLDERRIRQVLINLLNNAVKFTPEWGRIVLKVTTIPPSESGRRTHSLRFAVIDTGIGISPKNIKKLFQPFMQIDSALNRQYQGTGLGLALTKRIVELHGGQVGLTSEEGVGSCFMIDLPYEAAQRIPEQHPANLGVQTNDLPIKSPGESSPLLLLAEDNEANISTISNYLMAKDYRIEVAKNGQEAISQAVALSPDLILMDIQMPGMDGLEAMKRIREIPELARTPIIALTALAMDIDRDRCLQAGANEYLSKPVKLKQLTMTIQQLLTPPLTQGE